MASSISDSSWEITEADRAKYQGIFQKNDPNGTGKLNSQMFRPIFLQSKLSPEELFAIWTLVDPSRSGSLDIGQFSAAMHLIFGRLAGKSIPSQLPPGLITAKATPQHSEEIQIKIQLLEKEIIEKKQLLSQTSSADHQAETQNLKGKINLLYIKAPIHHPDFFKALEIKKGELESALKPHKEFFNLLRANKLEGLCNELSQVLKEISKINMECFKLEDAATHGYTIASNAPLIPATPASQDPIAIKAAAMLAQRLQKLNLVNTPSLPADAAARIESYTQEVHSDEARQAAELSATSDKLMKLSKQFIDNFSNLNQLASEVKAFQDEFEKIQSGAKFTTADLKNLLAELSLKSRSLYIPETPQPPKQEVEVKAAENFGNIRNIFNRQNDADPFAALITKKTEETSDPFTQLISKKSEVDSVFAPSPPHSPVKAKSSNPWANEVAVAESRAKVVTPASEEKFPKPSVKDFASLFSNPQKNQATPKEPPKIRQAEEAESKPFVIPPPPPPPPAAADPLPEPSPVEIPVAPPISKAPVEAEIPKESFSNNPFGKADSPKETKSNNPFGIPKGQPPQDFKLSVRAIYAYSEEGSALKFEEGDILNVTDEGDESAEWYLGHLTTAPDIEDWFPRAYVTREVDPDPVPEPPVQEPSKTTYKLIYEYAPLDDQGEPFGDSLEADVILEVVDDSDADWWLVQDPRPGQDGLIYVPANFLELVA